MLWLGFLSLALKCFQVVGDVVRFNHFFFSGVKSLYFCCDIPWRQRFFVYFEFDTRCKT